MTFNPANPESLAAFLAISFLVIGAILYGIHVASRTSAPKVAVGLLVWVSVLSLPAGTGWIRNFPFPGIPIFMFASLLGAFLLGLSKTGKELASGLPLAALVGFQAFRLPLELVLHSWGIQGTIPLTMTWSGENFDIITGIVAILCAPLANRHRLAAWFANLTGIVLLSNVGRVALMSSPVPFAWKVNPPLQLGLYLPYAWIAPVCVGGALLGHVVLTRALLSKRPSSPQRIY